MEQKNSLCDSVCNNQLLPLSSRYPWFVVDNLGAEENSSTNHIFYTLHETVSKYECQIPQLRGRHIRGYYHGWVVLSDPQDKMWSLWNAVTSKMISLPSLILNDGDSKSIGQCCLSAPPHNPNSVLLLTRTDKPTFVFFRLTSKKKNLRWIEISYAKQLKKITGEDSLLIYSLACCNAKLYAMNTYGSSTTFVIQLDLLFKNKKVKIKLLLLGMAPFPSWNHCPKWYYFLKGYCFELFCIIVAFSEKKLEGVYSFKLDMTSVMPEEMERFKNLDMSCKRWEDLEDWTDISQSQKMWEPLLDLKDGIFFVDICRDNLVYYRPAIGSELGGYIHIRDKKGKVLYSYKFKDNTISLSSTPSLVLPTSNVSLWECRLEDDHGAAKCVDSKQEEDQIVLRSVTKNEIGLIESDILNLPFDMFKMILEHCVGVEYMNFRATCKRCHVAVPLIQWSNETSLRKLRTYSLVSPWLMVVEKNQDVISFTDPVSGDVYFIKYRQLSIACDKIWCCRFGWLLFESRDFEGQAFFNPFTNDLRKLPKTDSSFASVCFSAPPTFPDCMVVGISGGDESQILIHYVAREPSWRTLRVGGVPSSIRFPTFIGQDFFALHGKGELLGFKDLGEEGYSSTFIKAKALIDCCGFPANYYLMIRDQDLLKVTVCKFGEHVEVFEWNDSKQEWEKINSLGNYIIFISRTTCLCIKAKTPEMENKIYFPLMHSKKQKILFYSLETGTYDTFNDGSIQQHFKDFLGATYPLFPHAWIEPNWSS